ncbi:hypothetical protein ACVDFE_30860 [Lentzea chajnantorensis]
MTGVTAGQLVAAVEQMTGLPWPDDGRLDWEVDGLAGHTDVHRHVLPLAAVPSSFLDLADRSWGTRHRAGASRFIDSEVVWWRSGDDAVALVGTPAAVVVLPARWLAEPPAGSDVSPVVADFLSGDGERVLSSVWAVFGTRDPEVLAPLVPALRAVEEATADVELGGLLVSNHSNLEHALDRVRLFAAGTCLCAAYPAHQFYDPAKESGRRHVRVVRTVPNDRQWVPDRVCECLDCGRRFQVEQGEYHYPWWKWTPVAG